MKPRGLLVLPGLFLGACVSSEPFPQTAIEGSFAATNPWPSGPGYAIGFSLNIIGETVSGQGWLGGAGDPLTPLTVVGQFTDPEFSLGLSSGPVAWGTITGTATASGLTGTYVMSQGAPPVVLVFVPQDSGAVGRYSGNITGEFSSGVSGAAGFGTGNGAFFLRLAIPNRAYPLLQLSWIGERLGVGTYELREAQSFAGTVALGPDTALRYFQVNGGQIRVDVSTRYAFIGEILLQAEEPATRLTVGLSTTFSAGCAVPTCQWFVARFTCSPRPHARSLRAFPMGGSVSSEQLTRRDFIHGAAAGAAAASFVPVAAAAALQDTDKAAVLAQVARQHDTTLQALREWIALPSIAAEDIGYPQGADYQARLARDAGFQHVEVIQTRGKPGVFATMDNGAKTWLGIYFMYDVKQYDPSEWSSPPLEGRLVDRPGLGKVIVGRGATNTKGPQMAVLAALGAFKATGRKPPVNIALVCEGEEEIGSPNFGDIVFKSHVEAALKKCVGIIIPLGVQSPDGSVDVNLGAKGIIEAELVATGEKWGRGPAKDIHSSLAAMVDSPAWHLVQALASLKKADGFSIAVEGWAAKVRPLSPRLTQILEAGIAKKDEATIKKGLGVQRWINDENFHDAQVRLVTQPTINIEGLVGGYTGPGGKTILPYKAVAKLDMRLVPDMTTTETLALLRSHLAKHGFGDIEVNMTGGYDPTETDPDSKLIQAMLATYRRLGVEPLLWPRLAGSWPGVTFTGAPLKMAAGQFGLGHGGGAHAPDEYYVIEAANPKVAGLDRAVQSYVEFLYSLA